MNLIGQIPKDFYKLFGSKYMEYYMSFLAAIYEESGRAGSALGLTEQECRAVINEKLAGATIDWSGERFDEEGSLLTRANMASVCLRYFEEWGWLKQDYDEALNSYVVSFPEYSRLFVELFQRLYREEDSRERESVLAVYSYLFTYSSDPEKNNEILESALDTTVRLSRMLGGMREGMRGYFDELSRQRDFRGIQDVLVKEINNSDSRKYAILTTTDSFYRYKEAVKELIDRNLSENEARRQELERELSEAEAGGAQTLAALRLRRAVDRCGEAMDLICRIEREFDGVEKRYNGLIGQKTIFASRAAARIRYLLREGENTEDGTVALINLLGRSAEKEKIAEELAERIRITTPHKVITERSLYSRRDREQEAFSPSAVEQEEPQESLEEFVLKPLYTHREIQEFRKKYTKDGTFEASADTVRSMEDLEKLFFVWQEATELSGSTARIEVGEDLTAKSDPRIRFSRLTIEEGENG
ncbi:MAG: DUF5716 family protein [Eubacteriales bacterium]|nr:DUF5716 family protein [Eubacteriales bacterium]